MCVVDTCNGEIDNHGFESTQLKKLEPVRIKINEKWLLLSAEFVASHPGGSIIYQYRLAFRPLTYLLTYCIPSSSRDLKVQ